MSNYIVRTLWRRDFPDGKVIDRNTFIEFILTDFKVCSDFYKKAMKEEYDVSDERVQKLTLERIIKEVDSKKTYKRPSAREKMIEKKYNEWMEFFTKTTAIRKHDIYFDIDPNQGTEQGISSVCIIRPDSTREDLGRCYDELIKSDYFKNAKGWEFKYETTEDSYRSCFRPWVEFILDEDIKNEIAAKKKALDESITNFYKGVTYWPVGYWGD